MSNGVLARALANRTQRPLEAFVPPAPQQGPVPAFLESQMPPAPRQGPPPMFFRSPAVSPEGLENHNPPMMPPQTVRATPLAQVMAGPAPMPQPQPMPPQEEYGPPEPYGPAAPPMPRNELERDYYRQLAQNPQGFDTGWLGRLFG